MELLVALPYSSRIDQRGDVRTSSHSAFVTDVTLHLARQNPNFFIYIPGEDTFGANFPANSDLMKKKLVKEGVEEERIFVDRGLNDTDSQLKAVRERFPEGKPTVVGMRFHISKDPEGSDHDGRVPDTMRRFGIEGKTVIAEDVAMRVHKGATKERLLKFANGKDKKVFGSEKIVRTLSRHILGRALLSAARIYTNPTVTDYHHVEPARKHFARARKAGII